MTLCARSIINSCSKCSVDIFMIYVSGKSDTHTAHDTHSYGGNTHSLSFTFIIVITIYYWISWEVHTHTHTFWLRSATERVLMDQFMWKYWWNNNNNQFRRWFPHSVAAKSMSTLIKCNSISNGKRQTLVVTAIDVRHWNSTFSGQSVAVGRQSKSLECMFHFAQEERTREKSMRAFWYESVPPRWVLQ